MMLRTMPQRLRLLYILLAGVTLLLGLTGALLKAGALLEGGRVGGWLALRHPHLMLLGFLGTLIGLERAVALPSRVVYAVPLLLWAGMWWPPAGGVGALLYAGAMTYYGRRLTPGPHLWAMVAGGLFLGWAYVADTISPGIRWVIPAKLFLLLTIFGERLELGRITMRRRWEPRLAMVLLFGLLLMPFAGNAYTQVMTALAALWLGVFDTARRIVRRPGLPRFIGITLLIGYAWLGLHALAPFIRMPHDMALHSFFLGFVFMMIYAHAPLIFPTIVGFRLRFGNGFYLPVALMNLSLLLRWGGLLREGALLSVAAVLLLPVVMFFYAERR